LGKYKIISGGSWTEVNGIRYYLKGKITKNTMIDELKEAERIKKIVYQNREMKYCGFRTYK